MEESQNDYTSDSLDAKAMMVKKLEVFVTRTLVRNCNKPNPQGVKCDQQETEKISSLTFLLQQTASLHRLTFFMQAASSTRPPPPPPPPKKKKYHHAENALFIVKNKKSEEDCENEVEGTRQAESRS